MSEVTEIRMSAIGQAVIVSPHDDDGIVGCGGLIHALPEKPIVVIVTDGHLGYHRIEHKGILAQIREKEALAAYAELGVPEQNLLFFRYPDMSLRNWQSWLTVEGHEGGYQKLFKVLRKYKPQTVFLPSEQDFHPDHKVSFDLGWVASFQARDTLMPDLGTPAPIKWIYVYQVWDHLEAVSHQFKLVAQDAKCKRDAMRAFQSQLNIVDELERMGTLKYDEEVFWLFREF